MGDQPSTHPHLPQDSGGEVPKEEGGWEDTTGGQGKKSLDLSSDSAVSTFLSTTKKNKSSLKWQGPGLAA